jgi:hypothetical protein
VEIVTSAHGNIGSGMSDRFLFTVYSDNSSKTKLFCCSGDTHLDGLRSLLHKTEVRVGERMKMEFEKREKMEFENWPINAEPVKP